MGADPALDPQARAMPATEASGRFTGVMRDDAFIDLRRRAAAGAVVPMERSYNAGRSTRPIASR